MFRDAVRIPGIELDDVSDPLGCAGFIDKWLAVTGLTGGTGALEWSHDGVTFFALLDSAGDPIVFATNGQIVEIPQAVPFIRINGSSMTGPPEFRLYRARP